MKFHSPVDVGTKTRRQLEIRQFTDMEIQRGLGLEEKPITSFDHPVYTLIFSHLKINASVAFVERVMQVKKSETDDLHYYLFCEISSDNQMQIKLYDRLNGVSVTKDVKTIEDIFRLTGKEYNEGLLKNVFIDTVPFSKIQATVKENNVSKMKEILDTMNGAYIVREQSFQKTFEATDKYDEPESCSIL